MRFFSLFTNVGTVFRRIMIAVLQKLQSFHCSRSVLNWGEELVLLCNIFHLLFSQTHKTISCVTKSTPFCACLFSTGREPGIPVQTGHVCVFGAPPNSVLQEQKIFVLVASSTWTSRPITVSYCLLIFLSPPYTCSAAKGQCAYALVCS